jgi:hypothetical protein
MTEAYPLQWPAGKPRKQYPERSKFGERSIDAATTILREELRRLGASNMVLSSNLRLRNDGLPYSKQAQPCDQGVAVYFTYKQQPMCFACDRWDRIQDNIYAIAMTIEALRGIERWGSGSMVEQAFTGFVALPGTSPWDILGVPRTATREQIESAYRKKARSAHPDNGGSHEAMTRLNLARDEALRLAA